MKAPLSTYMMQKILESRHLVNVLPSWIIIYPQSQGAFECMCIFNMCRSSLIHSSSNISATEMTRKRKSAGSTQPHCHIPTVFPINIFSFHILNTTLISVFILAIEEHSFGGAPYCSRISMSRSWFTVSNALTRSTNAKYVGRLWLCLMWRSILILKVQSCQPNPGAEPN